MVVSSSRQEGDLKCLISCLGGENSCLGGENSSWRTNVAAGDDEQSK